jgi:hypothetical protein
MKDPRTNRSRWLIDSIETSLTGCLLPAGASGVHSAITCLQDAGVQFFDVAGLSLLDDPSAVADEKGNILVPLQAKHDLLYPSWGNITPMTECPTRGGLASFAYVEEGHYFLFGQSAYHDDNSSNNRLADGQLQLARMLYSKLHPSYGWIDERSANMPKLADLRKHRLQYVFWANLFGPAYVQLLGRDFLLATLDAQVEEMDDGGIICVARENYVDWWKAEPTPMLKHFQSRIPSIKLYRAEIGFG